MAGAGTYAYIETGTIGTDAIKVGVIYKPALATPLGDEAILDKTVDPRFNSDLMRPSLAQSFTENATGEVFTDRGEPPQVQELLRRDRCRR
ncbi:MAG: hypothetical protein WKF47_04520 [Geodermatophilaceae bacterium]